METLILDATGISYIVKHAHIDLSVKNDPAGVIFGFTRQLLKLAKLHHTNQFVFTWDGPDLYRRIIYPGYKRTRRTLPKTPLELEYDQQCYKQFNLLYSEIIPALGFVNNFKLDGYEADDIIASIVEHEVGREKIVVSDDRDLLQILRSDVRLYFPIQGRFYTVEDFHKDYKRLPPATYAKIMEIAGCKSDEVPSIAPRVGKVSAIKFLRDELPPTHLTFKKITSPEAKKARRMNRALCKLPFPGYNELPPCPEIRLSPQPELKADDFLAVFEKYEFRSFMRDGAFYHWVEHLRLK